MIGISACWSRVSPRYQKHPDSYLRFRMLWLAGIGLDEFHAGCFGSLHHHLTNHGQISPASISVQPQLYQPQHPCIQSVAFCLRRIYQGINRYAWRCLSGGWLKSERHNQQKRHTYIFCEYNNVLLTAGCSQAAKIGVQDSISNSVSSIPILNRPAWIEYITIKINDIENILKVIYSLMRGGGRLS